MKRTIVILAAAAALALSCQREEAMSPDSGASYSFNLNITGGGFSNGTRADATVGWTVGENVFLFFQPEGEGVLDRCLTLTYDGSSFHQSGSYIPYGKLGTGGKLSAVYVPYLKGGVRPVFSEGCWSIDGGDVYYSCASGVAYTVSGQQVSATVAMSIPDGYVQFAVPASKAADGDMMSCNLVDAYDCVTLGADLTFTETPVEGKKMTGHKDGGNVFFWGKMNGTEADECELILASSVTGTDLVKKVDLHETAVAKNSAYNTDFYVLPEGALPGEFSISPTEKVHFAKGNLYCTDNRTGLDNPSFTFAFEDKQYQFHLRNHQDLMYYNGIRMTNYASLGKTYEELEDEERENIEFDDPTMIPNVQSDEYTSGFFQWVSDNALINISNGRYKKASNEEYDENGAQIYLPGEPVEDLDIGQEFDVDPLLVQNYFDYFRAGFGAFSSYHKINDTFTFLDGAKTDVVDFGEAYGDGKTWFALSKDEWTYLTGYGIRHRVNGEYVIDHVDNCRPNARDLLGFANVNGTYGMILAPDDWDCDTYPLTGDGELTEYGETEWADMEALGLVFLPAVGNLSVDYEGQDPIVREPVGQSVSAVNSVAYYWTRTALDNDRADLSYEPDQAPRYWGEHYAYTVYITLGITNDGIDESPYHLNPRMYISAGRYRYQPCSVRLVCR